MRSHIEAVFKVNMQNATSTRNLTVSENDASLEIFAFLDRYVENNNKSPRSAQWTYLFKGGQKIEKVEVF